MFRDYFANMEMVLLWQSFNVISFKRFISFTRRFQSSRKILWSFQLSKSRIPCSCPDGPVKLPDALLCREDSDSSACICPDIRATPSKRSLEFEKNLDSFANTDCERHLATVWTLQQHRPDAALIRKCIKCVMERRLQSSLSRHSQPPSGRHLKKSELVSI
jgi:hypothetical protein